MATKGPGGEAFVAGSVARITQLNWKIVTPPKNFYVDDAFAPVYLRFFTGLLRAHGLETHGRSQAGVAFSELKDQTLPGSIHVQYTTAPRMLIKYFIGNHQGYCVSATFQADLYPADKDQPVWSVREASCSTEPDVLAQRIYARMKQDKLI
ncbi:MAG: hypothetical protein WCD07_03160 [Burkholderiales bacterium]